MDVASQRRREVAWSSLTWVVRTSGCTLVSTLVFTLVYIIQYQSLVLVHLQTSICSKKVLHLILVTIRRWSTSK